MNGNEVYPTYEVYALRYATVVRRARDNFLAPAPEDAHDGPMPLDFFVWLIRGGGKTILVDTGFSPESGRARSRTYLCPPPDALARFGVDPGSVTDVIVTHLHYDHAGNVDAFGNARIHLQDAEMNYATGRCMCHPTLNHFFAVDDVRTMVSEVFAGRVDFHDGDATVAPGVSVHLIGGHTRGLQVVRVLTDRGWVVLASDAAHYYRNRALANPFPAIVDLAQMLEGYRRLDALADSPDHVVPGHDPEVCRRYPRVPVEGVDVFALHRPPIA